MRQLWLCGILGYFVREMGKSRGKYKIEVKGEIIGVKKRWYIL